MRLLYLFSLALIVSCTSVKPLSYNRTGEVECVEKGRTTISLVSTGHAHTKDLSYDYAMRNAFENLLFKGIPNSNQEKPIVSNEVESLKMREGFYQDLLVKKEYQRFVMDSSIEKSWGKAGLFNSDVYVKIDLQALKTYLEQNDITRKFGI